MSKKKKRTATQRPASPRERGLRAFRQNNFGDAIKQWSRLVPDADPTIRAALAEAHFRRALVGLPQPATAAADLQRAVELLPHEARYWYHLGLSLHRADRLEEALNAYARAADLDPKRRDLGYARGLAELEHDPHVSLEALPWLSLEDRAALTPIAALLRGEPQAVLADTQNWRERLKALGRAGEAAALWQGLAWLAIGQPDKAREALARPQGKHLRPGAEQVRAFYLGLAMAAVGKPQAALSEWTAAARGTAHARVSSRLPQSIALLHLRRLHELRDAGQWVEMLRLAQDGLAHAPAEPSLLRASLIASDRLARASAEAGDWDAAIEHWDYMHATMELHPDLGPVVPVFHNLAVAHEATEEWEPAAQAWAGLLRALPRRAPKKTPAPAPAGIPFDEFRVWLRRRILDDYKRSGQPGQAIAYYKQAVKAAPDDLDLRSELASALLANEQTIAARNEVQRILDRDPRHVGALLLQAEVHQARGERYAAEQSLRRVLEIDPAHDAARRGVGQVMRDRGVGAYNSGQYRLARDIYTEALQFSPAEMNVLVNLADTELVLKDRKAAEAHLEAALANGQADAYARVFDCWVKHRKEAEARQVLERAEAAGVASSHFYVSAAEACFGYHAPPVPGLFGPPPKPSKKVAKWERWGHELLQKALAVSTDRAETLRHILGALAKTHPAAAVEYARQLVELEPEEPLNLLGLGTLQAINQETAAKDTLRKAERLARKQGKKQLADEIAELRRQVGSPLFSLLPLISQLGPEDLEDLDDLFEGDDEWYDDEFLP